MCFDNKCVPVPDLVIDELRSKEEKGGGISFTAAMQRQKIRPGTPVFCPVRQRGLEVSGVIFSIQGKSRREKKLANIENARLVYQFLFLCLTQ